MGKGEGFWQREGDSWVGETRQEPAAAGSGRSQLFFCGALGVGESSWLPRAILHLRAGSTQTGDAWLGAPMQVGPCLAERLGETPSHSSTPGAPPCWSSSQTARRYSTRGPRPPKGALGACTLGWHLVHGVQVMP